MKFAKSASVTDTELNALLLTEQNTVNLYLVTEWTDFAAKCLESTSTMNADIIC